MRIQTVPVLALLAMLTACANPRVPDFMVKGELPFGHQDTPQAPQLAEVQQPARPKKEKKKKKDEASAVAPSVASAAPVAPPAAQPAPAARPAVMTPAPAAVISARPEAAPKRAPEAPPEAPVVGGFQPMRDKDKMRAIAAFAADAAPIGYLLKDIESARSQVVAGMNYELCLEVRRTFRETSGWRTRKARAEVYEDLSGNLTLMTWEEVRACP
ncbi:hypothetical protein [Asticcacaulis sp. AC402]|uniref:hypothetical protein n=1 Tax=Asticcacaulis sp. AC402 TaxID=1282361 RepID=UPI0003C40CE5|nr:hypothetical protein [Asticcacaulis sp. AC402]ESQ74149.1 hypothetical protein ABAC402_15990 [Asticcacaulis sp. AC402]